MSKNENGFTKTQQAMLDVLADGLSHPRAELHACLEDNLGPIKNIKSHLSLIRIKLRPIGQDIVCEYRGQLRVFYRHVRLLASAVDGKH